HVSREDLHHRLVVVLRGVLGEPFQTVDTADPAVDRGLLVSQLGDGLHEALGVLPLLSNFERPLASDPRIVDLVPGEDQTGDNSQTVPDLAQGCAGLVLDFERVFRPGPLLARANSLGLPLGNLPQEQRGPGNEKYAATYERALFANGRS